MPRLDATARCSLLLLLCLASMGTLLYQYSWMPNLDTYRSAISVPCIAYAEPNEHLGKAIDTIFFSTFTIEQPGQTAYLEATKRWHDSAVAVGLTPLLFPTDATNFTCHELLSYGLPCEQSLHYPYSHMRRTAARPPAVDTKYWYTLQFLKQGKRVM